MVANPLLLESLAILAATALGFGIVALAVAGLWRAAVDERRLLLAEVLAFEGIDMSEHVTGTGARQYALAAGRCMRCGAREQCEGWLAGRHAGGYEAFCPNAGYVERLKAGNS